MNLLFGAGICSSFPHKVGVAEVKRRYPVAQGTFSLCNSTSNAFLDDGAGSSNLQLWVRGRCPEWTRPKRSARRRTAQSETKQS